MQVVVTIRMYGYMGISVPRAPVTGTRIQTIKHLEKSSTLDRHMNKWFYCGRKRTDEE